MLDQACVLIVEDGSEYLDNLRRFVPGPRYLQARSGAQASRTLHEEHVDLIYLDMRFDRIPLADLLGDHGALTHDFGGDADRAWSHLQRNQGLYILDSLRQAGFDALPVILAYDFGPEPQRFANLRAVYPRLSWVGDAVTAEEIRTIMTTALAEPRDQGAPA